MAGAAHGARRQAQRAGLLLTPALFAGAVGCANVGFPPGAPPDSTPPVILEVRPDSGVVLADLHGPAIIQFDEVIDEAEGSVGGYGGGGFSGYGGGFTGGGYAGGGYAGGPTGGGGLTGSTASAPTGLGRLVLLSPVAGDVKVSWHRTSIHIQPKEGWKPNRIYRLQLLPGVTDLQRNVLKHGRTIIFSTGPDLRGAGTITGDAVQWVEQRAMTLGLIRAVPLPDTLGYLAYADSGGHFRMEGMPPGRYVVYAIVDQNGNRHRDRREAYDSTIVTLDTGGTARTPVLWAFVHDTGGPKLRGAEPIDSLTFRLTFTSALDPGSPIDTSQVKMVLLPDSTPVALRAVLTPPLYDSLVAHERAAADSARKAADTTHKAAPGPAADTTKRGGRRADTLGVPITIGGARQPARASTQDSLARIKAAADSALKLMLAGRPIPTDRLVVRAALPLTPQTRYLIRVRHAKNLNGAAADGQAVLTIPKAKPPPPSPRDTTHGVPPDTSRGQAPRDTTKP